MYMESFFPNFFLFVYGNLWLWIVHDFLAPFFSIYFDFGYTTFSDLRTLKLTNLSFDNCPQVR